MSGLVIQYASKSYMDDGLMEKYLKRVIGEFSFNKRLLIWDSFRCHISEATKTVLRRMGIHSAVVPGGATGLIQAADVSWNKSFKHKIQERYEEWMMSGEHSFTKNGNMRSPSFVLLAKWIQEAWNLIPFAQITDSLKQCAVTNALDGSEDDLIECFKLGHPCHAGLQQLKAADEIQVVEEVLEDEGNDLAIDDDSADEEGVNANDVIDDNISWCDSDESN